MNKLNTKVVSEKVIFPDNFGGIDTSNVIADNPSIPYTAQQDCWVFCETNNNVNLKIDNDYLRVSMALVRDVIAVKKGQVVSGDNISSIKVYGIKY